MAVLTVETTSTGYKNLFAYCENNPVIFEDSTGQMPQALIVIGGFMLDYGFDIIGITLSVIEVVNNPEDPWAKVGLACDIIDLASPIGFTGEVFKILRYAEKMGAGAVLSFIIKHGDEAAEFATKHGDEIIESGTDIKITFPQGDAQLKHIFRDAEGHLPDTPANRKKDYRRYKQFRQLSWERCQRK